MRRPPKRKLEQMVGYHDLVADLQRPGCPICHGIHRSAWRHLDGLLWESVNDPGIRQALRDAHGFCRQHAWMAVRVASAQAAALGMAILVEDLLGHVIADAEESLASQENGPLRRRRHSPLRPHGPCPICVSTRHRVECYVQILAAAQEGTMPDALAHQPGRGICVPHLAEGLAFLEGPEARARYLAIFKRGADELRHELMEFARKHDYRFHSEGFTDGESTAWRRGVHRLVGEPLPNSEPRR